MLPGFRFEGPKPQNPKPKFPRASWATEGLQVRRKSGGILGSLIRILLFRVLY